MNRLALPLAASAILALFAGCNPADTAPNNDEGTPTPPATPIYSNETYAKALKTASYRLRGLQPSYADTQYVLAGGMNAYNEKIDEYSDPATNPLLPGAVRELYRTMFLMGNQIGNINYDQVPNLATWLVTNDLPVSEMLTAEYCVNGTLAGTPPVLTLSVAADCTDVAGAPFGAPAGERAGVISNGAFLEKYGTDNTVNMRRTSVVHQLFACGIYPDPDENPPPLARTNMAEASWPNNPSGTPDDPSDDFPDPGEGYADCPDDADPSNGVCIEDPAGPSARLHKKYQSKLPSASGPRCVDCHGQLNARRPVFTFYAPDGTYDAARSIGLAPAPLDNVEAPSVNGDQDYCGVITPGDTDDDMEPGDKQFAFDCSAQNPQASYLGQPMTTLKDFGALITNSSINDRFYTCMTTRHYNWILGKSQGELSMQAAGGSAPPALAPATLAKYSTVYEASGWNSRELFRTILKGNEFLSSQGPPVASE